MSAASGAINTNLNRQFDLRVSSGCAGLDAILHGGFPQGRIYLVEGDPGAGKTTLAVQFMREGISKGERTLYLTLSESREDLVHAASSHGMPLDDVEIDRVAAELAAIGISEMTSSPR